MKKLSLGNLTIDGPFMQAPLSGYTDQAMCMLALEFGAPLVFSALMLDKSVTHPGVLDKPLYSLAENEHPIGGQLLGSDPESMATAAKALVDYGYDLIDLNFGCPAPKVTQKLRGGFILSDPELAKQIISTVRAAISCPLTVKVRVGTDKSDLANDNFWKIVEICQNEGVDGLIVHGRTVKQAYKARADWDKIGQVKERFPDLTVIGSGDVFKAEEVVERLETYKLDGILIARGCIGNPWIFQQVRALLQGQEKPAGPTLEEVGQICLRHFNMIRALYPAHKTHLHFRKFCVYFAKRHPERKKVVVEMIKAPSAESLIDVIKKWFPIA